ncbi:MULTISPECIES: hypothetical protein [Streptacidiphilus]|uniref:Uncharacterized protein n=1 Tax=Streptacidiphilus cavernicola TaxID=3342716 RepID=A0ABV6UP87_9ACTN|nr:hypothetical protein [Streptacidiphilus jeojiense]
MSNAQPTTPPEDVLTPGGQRLAQRYGRLQDLVDLCARAAEAGDWVTLSDHSGELSVAADEVSAAAAFVTTEAMPTSPHFMLTAAARLREADRP